MTEVINDHYDDKADAVTVRIKDQFGQWQAFQKESFTQNVLGNTSNVNWGVVGRINPSSLYMGCMHSQNLEFVSKLQGILLCL